MPIFRAFLVLLAFACFGANVALAQTAASLHPVVSAKPPSYLPIQAQLNQLLGVTTTAAPTISTTPPPAAAPAVNVNSNPEDMTAEPGETFGTRALDFVLNLAALLANQGALFLDNFADLPQASGWLSRQFSDDFLRERWQIIGTDLLLTVGLALAGTIAFELVLLPPRRAMRRRRPSNLVKRLAVALGLLALEFLPILLFIGVALTLLDKFETLRLPRFVVLNIVYAIGLNRLIMILGRTLFAPKSDLLRLVPLTSEQARYLYRQLGAFSFVAIYGYFLVDVARAVHVPPAAINAFGDLLGLVFVVMTVMVIAKKRAFVSVLLRGDLSAARGDLTPMQSLRLWFARSWHGLTIAYLVLGYLVTALGVEDGFSILLRGTALTFLIFVLLGLALYMTGSRGAAKAELRHPILRFFLRLVIWILAAASIAASWGANIPVLLATPFGQRVTGSLFSIGVTTVVLTLIYEFASSAIERHLNRQDSEGHPLPPSARMRTLLPMMRNAAFILFSAIVGLVVLSEAGVNIAPLLAGAGVIGVAVGFGSQTLVKDFLTGLFIVAENVVAIGDVVKIGDHSGVVEAMSMRTIRLRDAEGAVHFLPFSEV